MEIGKRLRVRDVSEVRARLDLDLEDTERNNKSDVKILNLRDQGKTTGPSN